MELCALRHRAVFDEIRLLMSCKIIRTSRGRTKAVASGSRAKMNRRLKQLRTSTTRGASGHGGITKVTYHIEEGSRDA